MAASLLLSSAMSKTLLPNFHTCSTISFVPPTLSSLFNTRRSASAPGITFPFLSEIPSNAAGVDVTALIASATEAPVKLMKLLTQSIKVTALGTLGLSLSGENYVSWTHSPSCNSICSFQGNFGASLFYISSSSPLIDPIFTSCNHTCICNQD